MLDSLAVDERPLLRWGVNLQAGMYADAAAREAQLARLATLGVTIARISMPWSWVETAAGHMDWRYADQIVADLQARGYDGWYVLEQDTSRKEPKDAAAANLAFVQGLQG